MLNFASGKSRSKQHIIRGTGRASDAAYLAVNQNSIPMKMLATDLDGTFLGGTEEERQSLYSMLKQRDDFILVFVTGRGLETVKPLLQEGWVPTPDYIISDVGATVVKGADMLPVDDILEGIEQQWPGDAVIRDRLLNIEGLRQQLVPMQRRCSYFFDSDTDLDGVYKASQELNVDVLLSAGKFLDILPKHVNKGTTLEKLVSLLNFETSSIVVAGDTLNDLSLFKTGYRGIVVGGAEAKLLDALQGSGNVYLAESRGAAGIAEGLKHYRFI